MILKDRSFPWHSTKHSKNSQIILFAVTSFSYPGDINTGPEEGFSIPPVLCLSMKYGDKRIKQLAMSYLNNKKPYSFLNFIYFWCFQFKRFLLLSLFPFL